MTIKHLEALAGITGLRRQFVGLSFGMAAMLMTSSRQPRCSSASLFFILALQAVVKHMCIYKHFIKMMKNLCCYTPEPPCPQLQRVGALGLG
jgi:hypothetical protein